MTTATQGSGPHLTVAIATFRRVERLTVLLPIVASQVEAAIDAGQIAGGRVLVVDNDPAESATATIAHAAANASSRAPIVGVVEHQPGIAFARNRLLAESSSSRLLAFIDDDETPRSGWLSGLLDARAIYAADAIAGPVVPTYEVAVAAWIEKGPFHASGFSGNGTPMDHAASGNLLLDLDLVRSAGVTFAEGLGTRGGEDTAFTMAFVRAGGRIVWSDDAIVDEVVVAARATPQAILKRSAATGAGHSDITLQNRSAGRDRTFARCQLTAQGAARFAAGLAGVALGSLTRSPEITGNALHRMARGAGFAIGAWGFIHDSYSRNGARQWRRG